MSSKSRIAIIGGGIGGTVTAYEISKLAAKDGYEIEIDLFEENKIGGRVATVKVNGQEFEAGGTIIHIDNEHMTNYVESNGLHWYTEPPYYQDKSAFGLYDGEEFVFVSSDSRFMNLIQVLWRYGFDALTLKHAIVSPLLSDFKRIYEGQKEQKHFDDVHSLLSYMNKDFPDLMKVQFDEYLRSLGYSDLIINELVYITTNINYNQDTTIPVFVGSVSLAGAEEGSLRSVDGGNRLIAETLLDRSDANLISARVESITRMNDSSFALEVENMSHVYDYVVVACPTIENSENNLKFEGFPDLKISPIKYQKTITTFIHGKLNYTFFNYNTPEKLPNQILSINNDSFFNCISAVHPITFDESYDNKVFKIFSKDVLTEEQLDLLFLTRDSTTVIPWLAYPLYDTRDRNLSFVLHENLYYLNAIEWAASAMEMSAISGVNIALHLHNKLGK